MIEKKKKKINDEAKISDEELVSISMPGWKADLR
jgi:hypothetical protein